MYIVKHFKSQEEYIAVISFLHWKNVIIGADGEDVTIKDKLVGGQGVAVFDEKGFLIAQGFDEIYKYINKGKL